MALISEIWEGKHGYITYSAEAKNVQSATYPDPTADAENVYYAAAATGA